MQLRNDEVIQILTLQCQLNNLGLTGHLEGTQDNRRRAGCLIFPPPVGSGVSLETARRATVVGCWTKTLVAITLWFWWTWGLLRQFGDGLLRSWVLPRDREDDEVDAAARRWSVGIAFLASHKLSVYNAISLGFLNSLETRWSLISMGNLSRNKPRNRQPPNISVLMNSLKCYTRFWRKKSRSQEKQKIKKNWRKNIENRVWCVELFVWKPHSYV